MKFFAGQWCVDTMGELAGEKQTKIQAKISTKTSGIFVFMDKGNSFMPEIYTKTCTHLECHTELSPHCL